MPFGYCGKILHVDLTKGKIFIEKPTDIFYRKYLGGRNIIGYYLLKELPEGADPLGAENVLVYATSVLTGIPAGGLSRHSIGAKSPVTGGWADSEVGGFWGAELKFAGFDAIVIKGKSEKPVYIWIHDSEAEIKNAEYLWGKTTGEVQKMLYEELKDDKIRISQIGPAGEKLVQFANIIEDLHDAAGRNGLGAVMGSKNLKAVVVKGSHRKIEVADVQGVTSISQKFASKWKDFAWGLHEIGTSQDVLGLNAVGGVPTRNFNESVFESAELISGERMKDTIVKKIEGCFACAIRCKRVVETEKNGKKADPMYGGPEWETIGALGSNLGNSDMDSIAVANALCNAYGMDTISAGTSIALMMECYEKGIIDKSKTDGLDLKFGNADAMLALIEKIAKRQGVGDILASGLKKTLEYLGPGSEKYAMHVKGQYLPMHEPRLKFGVGLGYAVAPGGADHLQISHDPFFEQKGIGLEKISPLGIIEPMKSQSLGPDKVRFFSFMHRWTSLLNVLDICFFTAMLPSTYDTEDITNLVRFTTGWNVSLWELLKAGERGLTMARLINTRNNVGPEQDTLPERFFTPIPKGPIKGAHMDKDEFEKAKKLYYEMMGWDPLTGKPTFARLVELGLEWAA
ncbi:aldehyde ferredoxin oxidoreductase [Biomaibacter acetigenes]|uniref:Aldehyde ferredoxin oxidoreductase n=1 Tax=Biomaibacter acetigenes TaxID=2316383 RepID=A0A3G2R2D6_9FIRM|nr:aldehyde ferredoxin oxidoreductase family protein [Biomaibacter acetigenes]AYO29654.1 aldehyde ferredoxin oxidoreductase [Biomaibacter acetigenes]